MSQNLLSQRFDMEFKPSEYSLDSLGVLEIDLEYSETLKIFNHGIHKPNFDNYLYTGTSFFITRVKNHSIGLMDASNYNNIITIKPYIVRKKLVSNNDYSYKLQDKVDTQFVKNITDNFTKWFDLKTDLKTNFLNDSLFVIDEKSFKKIIILKNHLKNISFISDYNFKTGDGLYLVPIIAEIHSSKKQYYHVELHFYEDGKLLFHTSISAHLNKVHYEKHNKTNKHTIYNQIIESLFHQIHPE